MVLVREVGVGVFVLMFDWGFVVGIEILVMGENLFVMLMFVFVFV